MGWQWSEISVYPYIYNLIKTDKNEWVYDKEYSIGGRKTFWVFRSIKGWRERLWMTNKILLSKKRRKFASPGVVKKCWGYAATLLLCTVRHTILQCIYTWCIPYPNTNTTTYYNTGGTMMRYLCTVYTRWSLMMMMMMMMQESANGVLLGGYYCCCPVPRVPSRSVGPAFYWDLPVLLCCDITNFL